MRAGKTAVVTGSTSGIGLGIASALAGQGANIVLNGFGPADEIEKIVSDLKRQLNVGVMYQMPTSPIRTRSKTWWTGPAPNSAVSIYW